MYKVTIINDELLSYNNRITDYKIEEIRLQIRPYV